MKNVILLVEDDADAAASTSEALAHMGYDVQAPVASAAACLDAVRARRPDLVLMDIHLAGDLDGIEAARLLRDEFDIPVVLLSGFADAVTIERAKVAGAHGYLLKPFRWNELQSAVQIGLFRHHLQRQLRERERWLSSTLQAIGDAAIALDTQGRVAFMNAAAESLLQISESSARGLILSSEVRLLNENTRERIGDPFLLAIQGGPVTHLPANTALVAAGRELPVRYSVGPIRDEQGNVAGVVTVIKDLTEQRLAQQQLAVADRLASLGALAAGIAHEINNPLTYIMGNIELLAEESDRLREGLPQSSDAGDLHQALRNFSELAREASVGAEHVARIVGDIGMFARRPTGPVACDVVARMEWALRVSNSALTPRARVRRVFLPVPPAFVDEARLGQVFLNLLLNAAHAMRDANGGPHELTVSIALAPIPLPGSRQSLRIAIADTGCGMPEDVIKRIFEPFFTTKASGLGTGLGLAVCRTTVAEMGGDITVSSAPGKGTCFVVRVPVADADAAAADGALPASSGARGRVLLLDDDARVLGAVRRMLQPRHDVVAYESARAALAAIRDDPSIDVIICDLLMPEMNGVQVYQAVNAISPELSSRIVFLSGGVAPEESSELLASLPNVALQKPPAAEQLLRAIDVQLMASGRGKPG